MDNIIWNEKLEVIQTFKAMEALIAIVKKAYDLHGQLHIKAIRQRVRKE